MPILIETCDYKNWKGLPDIDNENTEVKNNEDATYISNYQFVPQKVGKLIPINKWEYPEDAWVQVIDIIRAIIKK